MKISVSPHLNSQKSKEKENFYNCSKNLLGKDRRKQLLYYVYLIRACQKRKIKIPVPPLKSQKSK